METKIIVLYARPWSMVDESTGQPRTGITIQYLTTDSLAPHSSDDQTEFGYQPCKISIPSDKAAKLVSVPGLYNAKLELRASKGQNILGVADLDFISDFAVSKK